MTSRNENPGVVEQSIADAIGRVEYRDVPDGFSKSVMSSVGSVKKPLWKRFLSWINSPLNMRITPLRIAVGTAMIILAVFLSPMLDQVQAPDGQGTPGTVPVRFELGAGPQAVERVSVIGSFNDWTPESSVMRYDSESDVWYYETYLPPGDHEYVFLINGERVMPDPGARFSRSDGFGNVNSIMFVRSDEQKI